MLELYFYLQWQDTKLSVPYSANVIRIYCSTLEYTCIKIGCGTLERFFLCPFLQHETVNKFKFSIGKPIEPLLCVFAS